MSRRGRGQGHEGPGFRAMVKAVTRNRRHHNTKGLRQIKRGRTREWAERMEKKMVKLLTCGRCSENIREDPHHPGLPAAHMCSPKKPRQEESVRPEVVEFSEAMERKLKKNDHKKPHWHDMAACDLADRLDEELAEFNEAWSKDDPEAMRDELIDVANFAMMLWHKLGAADA